MFSTCTVVLSEMRIIQHLLKNAYNLTSAKAFNVDEIKIAKVYNNVSKQVTGSLKINPLPDHEF